MVACFQRAMLDLAKCYLIPKTAMEPDMDWGLIWIGGFSAGKWGCNNSPCSFPWSEIYPRHEIAGRDKRQEPSE